MAYASYRSSRERKATIVPWNDMRNRWVRCAGQRNRGRADDVKRYFNTFATKNPGYIFTIAKKFNDLKDVCITAEQCSSIKATLETSFGLVGCLDEANSLEVSSLDCTTRSFRNAHDFREFRENTLATMNSPVIRAKHAEAKQHYDRVQRPFTSCTRAFQIICFDIEVYEHDHKYMLEIGYVICWFSPAVSYNTKPSSFNTQPSPQLVTTRHFIIRENLRYKNGDRVPDNRYGFKFGVSETLSMADAVEKFRDDVTECDYILGHSVQHDEDYLKNIGVDLRVLGKEMFDTQMIQTYKESRINRDKYFMRSLSYLLKEYNLNYQDSHLHNGGCDAFYTMMVFLRQMDYSAGQVNDIIAS